MAELMLIKTGRALLRLPVLQYVRYVMFRASGHSDLNLLV